ncbi:hypothetical protein [Streptomyces violaceusniger]|uniref:Uncharacterized protein n=1 Tax=Streptomyces violaceusniger (strain Tu 4113) TaxID=653045 RepID=G2NZC0_STRV4|nr:hypothetical protein [Streptomyces violaceusniger]AEM83163.1 hypothetical protein Strvi_3490 [Streptomyces violaceusniger Tu 4113]
MARMEWIDPRYADLVAAMRKAQAETSRQAPPDNWPIRGFIIPDVDRRPPR